MASNSLDAVFPRDHVFYQIQGGFPDHRVIQSHHFFPRWYYSWFTTFSRMFPDHLDDCGLEMASAVGKRTINGSLIQAMAERWNPRTCTFWFPWGEMTLLMDEFNDIMGLPEPAGRPDDPVEQQFLINIKGVDVREALARATGSRSWPLTEINGSQFIDLFGLYRKYGAYEEVDALSRAAKDRIQHAMVLCTVGLAFFQDGQNFIDVRVAQLFRRWGSKQTRQLSVSMTALAFLYRGLARFALGETILVEGCTYALQSWFLRHVPSKASSFRFNSKQPKTAIQCRALIEKLHREEIVWDFFDRRETVPRYTYARSKRYRLLGPFFCVDYQPERCLRQFSQRQVRANIRFPTGNMPEFNLQSDQWSGAYHVTKYTWDSFISLSIFPGPNVSSEYREWWQTVCPPSLCL
jgi:hypothetical protein